MSPKINISASFGESLLRVHLDILNIDQIYNNGFSKLHLGALFILSLSHFNILEQNALSVIKEKSDCFWLWPETPAG